MAWLILFIAGLFEICMTMGLKYSEGFSRLWPSVATVAAMFISFFLLSITLKTLPIGTAYAVWTGIGVIGTAILGIIIFNEAVTVTRIICLALIIIGILGLKLLTISSS